MAYNSNPSAWNHYDTNYTCFVEAQRRKTQFSLAQLFNLWLFIVFYVTLRQMKQNYKHSRRLPAFVLPPLGCFITLDLWLCTAALSSATRRVGWPRVFTTWIPMSTTSCDCCTSRGGKTSQRRRYAEWNIKGSVSGINVGCPVPPTGAITGFTQPLYKGRWHSLLDKLLRACCHSCQSGCELPRAVLWLCGDEVIFPYVKKYFFPITFIFF